MSDYLDTSLLVSIFVTDANSAAAIAFLQSTEDVVTSAWAAAEYSSALAIQLRMGRLSAPARQTAERALDVWLREAVAAIAVEADDVARAKVFLQQGQTPLRTPDALHLAICERQSAALATFDLRLRDAASEWGVRLSAL